MVCQAAGQTRFRAFNHQVGISGDAAVVVKIIACYQPLLDCQAEYFRQLLVDLFFMDTDLVSKCNCCANNLARSLLQFHCYAANMVVPSLDLTPASYEPGDCPNFVFKLGGWGLINLGVELSTSSASKEDSDEIDALLYSDSEDEASTCHSPTEEVASSLAVPGKRKRIDESNLSSLVDTATSSGAYSQSMVHQEAAESSCGGGEEQCEEKEEDEDEDGERKRVKKERIQETVELLSC